MQKLVVATSNVCDGNLTSLINRELFSMLTLSWVLVNSFWVCCWLLLLLLCLSHCSCLPPHDTWQLTRQDTATHPLSHKLVFIELRTHHLSPPVFPQNTPQLQTADMLPLLLLLTLVALSSGQEKPRLGKDGKPLLNKPILELCKDRYTDFWMEIHNGLYFL